MQIQRSACASALLNREYIMLHTNTHNRAATGTRNIVAATINELRATGAIPKAPEPSGGHIASDVTIADPSGNTYYPVRVTAAGTAAYNQDYYPSSDFYGGKPKLIGTTDPDKLFWWNVTRWELSTVAQLGTADAYYGGANLTDAWTLGGAGVAPVPTVEEI